MITTRGKCPTKVKYDQKKQKNKKFTQKNKEFQLWPNQVLNYNPEAILFSKVSLPKQESVVRSNYTN